MRAVEVWLSTTEGDDVKVGVLREILPKNYYLPTLDFTYDIEYRRSERGFALSSDMPLVDGSIELSNDRKMFAGLADSLPDDWGHRLIKAQHVQNCRQLGIAITSLREFDFLLNQSDAARIGALRFRNEKSKDFLQPISDSTSTIEEVINAAIRFDEDDATSSDIQILGGLSSPLGGVRPKITEFQAGQPPRIVKLWRDLDRGLDVEAWEAVALGMAADFGMNVPTYEHKRYSSTKSVLFLDRFDRSENGRIAYQSMKSALGFSGDSGRIFSYQEMAEFVAFHCDDSTQQLQQLFRKAALSIAINDIDDHPRNLGFIRETHGWVLAPFFDMNPGHPDSSESSATWITRNNDRSARHNFSNLIDDCKSYRLTKLAARTIVDEIIDISSTWRERAQASGISDKSIARYEDSFIKSD